MTLHRRGFTRCMTALAALALTSGAALAQSSPYPMARIVVGYPPGGFTDATARLIADGLQPGYAQATMVENRPGAAGRLALTELQRRPADGSNMLFQIESVLTLVPLVDATATVTLAELAPVTPVAAIRHAFAVGPLVPAEVRTLDDFLAWAKANPSLANYGSPGANTSNRLLIETLSQASGVKLNHIPYKGSSQGVIDLLGGQIAAMSSPIGDYLPHLRDGRVRVLGLASASRSKLAPDIPTFAELGYPQVVADETAGMFMLKDTPPADLQRAALAIQEIVQRPATAEALARIGLEPLTGTPADYARHLHDNVDVWRERVKASGFKAER